MQGIYKQNITKVRSRQRVKPAAVQPIDMVSQKSICKKQEKNSVRACPVVTTMIFVHRPRPAPGQ